MIPRVINSARNILLVGNYGTGWATTKLDGQGKQLWSVRYPGVSVWGSYVADVTTDCAGHIFVTGTSLTQPCAPECYGTHLFTLKYDPNGHLLWMARFLSAAGESDAADTSEFVSADQAGGAYVVGKVSA